MKINLGSGPFSMPGWINFDSGVLPVLSKVTFIRKILIKLGLLSKNYEVSWPSLKLVDVRKKLPLQDNSVHFFYCSHVLEHFERWEALNLLKECRRSLIAGGKIRLVVPDIAKICRQYLHKKDLNKTNDRSGRDICREWWGWNRDTEPVSFWQRVARKFIRGHQWHYDEEEIGILLKEAGFTKIKYLKFRKGMVPDIDKLDLEGHKNLSLYVEAEKT